MAREIILRPKGDNTATFSVRVNRELLGKFDELSTSSGYSRNELICHAMREYIENVKFVAETGEEYKQVKTAKRDKKR